MNNGKHWITTWFITMHHSIMALSEKNSTPPSTLSRRNSFMFPSMFHIKTKPLLGYTMVYTPGSFHDDSPSNSHQSSAPVRQLGRPSLCTSGSSPPTGPSRGTAGSQIWFRWENPIVQNGWKRDKTRAIPMTKWTPHNYVFFPWVEVSRGMTFGVFCLKTGVGRRLKPSGAYDKFWGKRSMM